MYIDLWSGLAGFVNKAGGSVCDYQKLSIGQQDEWNSV